MSNPRAEHYPSLRCRKCEAELGKPLAVQQVKYSVIPTKYGAVVRQCKECRQWWLAYMEIRPHDTFKIILKMIDKVL